MDHLPNTFSNFWTFNWLFSCPLYNLVPDDQKSSIDWNLTVDKFISNVSWNREKLSDYLPWVLVRKVLAIPLPIENKYDTFIWGPSPNGTLTVKSATWLQNEQMNSHNKAPVLRKLWNLNIPPKIKIFAWLLIRGRLATRGRLHKFMKNIDPTCPICHADVETQDHLMIHCPFVKEVWKCAQHCPNPLLWQTSLVDWIAD